jgi:lipid A disaccharide synthetase
LIQHDAQPELIGQHVLERLDEAKSLEMQNAFMGLHKELKRDASEQAAEAIADLLERNHRSAL